MKCSVLFTVLLIVLVVVVSGQTPAPSTDSPVAAPWSYADQANWGNSYSKCDPANNMAQAPMSFLQVPVDFSLRPLQIEVGHTTNYSIKIETKKSLHVVLHDISSATTHPITKRQYTLQQIEVFSPSLHESGGAKADAELHFVYQLEDLPGEVKEKTSKRVDSTFMINAVLLNAVGDVSPNRFLEMSLGRVEEPLVEGEFDHDFEVEQAFPNSRDYVHYTASLAMPPCTEGIEYYVFCERTSMSVAQLTRIRNALQLAEPNPLSNLTAGSPVSKVSFAVEGNVRATAAVSTAIEAVTPANGMTAAEFPSYIPRRFIDFVGDDVLLKSSKPTQFTREVRHYANAALGLSIAAFIVSFIAMHVGSA